MYTISSLNFTLTRPYSNIYLNIKVANHMGGIKYMSTFHQFLAESMVTKSFHDQELIEDMYGDRWGVNNSIAQIKKVLVHRPGEEVLQLNKCKYEPEAGALVLRNQNGQIQSYCRAEQPPNLELLQTQHDAMTKALREAGVEVIELEGETLHWTNRLFTRDIGMVVPGGVILSRFALQMRYGETKIALQNIAKLGMPILGTIQGNGYMEGGSFAVIDEKTAFVGRSVRVNQEGIEQLRQILSWQNMELIAIDLPAHLIHLDEAFLMLDVDKALVDPTLLPFWFLEDVKARGITLIDLDPSDPPLTNNCLAVAPGKVLFPATGARTMERLVKGGIEVIPVDVSEINKMGGGIHCATLPLIRENISN